MDAATGRAFVLRDDSGPVFTAAYTRYLKDTLSDFVAAGRRLSGERKSLHRETLAAVEAALRRQPRETLRCFASPAIAAPIHCFAVIEQWPAWRREIETAFDKVLPRLRSELSGAPEKEKHVELAAGLRLGLEDANPIALEEAHPEKSGNGLSLGGRTPQEWAASLNEAIGLIESAAPGLVREMTSFDVRVIPVGYGDERHCSASYREAVGCVYLTLHPSTLMMAQALIHEFQHNKLNLASYGDPILHNAFHPLYASPVRPDPRPLWGVLLAAHAFLVVAVFYRRLREQRHPLALKPEFEKELLEIDLKNRQAMEVLREHADWTPFGRELMAGLEELNSKHLGEREGSGADPANSLSHD